MHNPRSGTVKNMQFDANDVQFLSPWIADDAVNSYGYRVNIRNPYINDLYRQWCFNHEIPAGMPMSDAERFEFELAVIPHLEKKFRSKAHAPYVSPKVRERLSVELLKRIYGVKGMDIAQDIKKEPPSAERKAV